MDNNTQVCLILGCMVAFICLVPCLLWFDVKKENKQIEPMPNPFKTPKEINKDHYKINTKYRG